MDKKAQTVREAVTLAIERYEKARARFGENASSAFVENYLDGWRRLLANDWPWRSTALREI